ncbi:hypothetical protein ABT174_08810 [Streptomyces sparsogenes]|uniref:hypothetical protein n=1 Tax=Streptomyces sparsogenes TaxID=67365 RepID=UPI0033317E62
MPPHDSSPVPDRASVLAELQRIRRVGLTRLHELAVPALAQCAVAWGASADGDGGAAVEALLRAAVDRVERGSLYEAALYSLGLAPGTRDWPAADRRRRAADVYRLSVERFRKRHELIVLGQISDQVLRLGHPSLRPDARPRETDGGERAHETALTPRHTHHTLRVRTASGGFFTTVVHVHPVDLLRDVDVVLSPTNTHLALSAPYKASVSAALRRAAARRGPLGDLVHDYLDDEVRQWILRHGRPGQTVPPGTVAPTGAGALERQGVRRVYHAAIATPRPGTNEYDVLPSDVTRAATRAFEVLAEERDRFTPALRSICLPLLGAGRGGLTPAASAAALWAAVDAELARFPEWEVHWVVRRPSYAELLERMLCGPANADGPYGPSGSARSRAGRGPGPVSSSR